MRVDDAGGVELHPSDVDQSRACLLAQRQAVAGGKGAVGRAQACGVRRVALQQRLAGGKAASGEHDRVGVQALQQRRRRILGLGLRLLAGVAADGAAASKLGRRRSWSTHGGCQAPAGCAAAGLLCQPAHLHARPHI